MRQENNSQRLLEDDKTLDGVAADVTTKALTYLILAINPDGGSDQIIQVLFTSQDPPPIDFSTLHQIVKTQICASDADVKKYIIRALQSITGKDLSSSHSEFVKGLVRTFDGRLLPVPTWPSEMPMPELLAAIVKLHPPAKMYRFMTRPMLSVKKVS
ncbi:hypothetical protein QL093DRAFT_2082679 [Fusarium oxysporum]|nr:hypothetical protein QL093DRAFT_2082679 [Fusarium oxysporum]